MEEKEIPLQRYNQVMCILQSENTHSKNSSQAYTSIQEYTRGSHSINGQNPITVTGDLLEITRHYYRLLKKINRLYYRLLEILQL